MEYLSNIRSVFNLLYTIGNNCKAFFPLLQQRLLKLRNFITRKNFSPAHFHNFKSVLQQAMINFLFYRTFQQHQLIQ